MPFRVKQRCTGCEDSALPPSRRSASADRSRLVGLAALVCYHFRVPPIDRVTLGRVIDFLNVGIGPLGTGIFNVADMAIIAGVVMLIVEGVRKTYTPAVSNPRG